MTNRTLPWAGLLLGGAFLLGSAPAFPLSPGPGELQAQQGERSRSGEISREEMVRRLVEQFERRMVRELNLSSRELESIRTVTGEFRRERYQLMRERNRLLAEIREKSRSGISPQRGEQVMNRLREIREEELELERREEIELRAFLDPVRILQLKILRDELVEQIRRVHHRSRRRGSSTR